MYAKGKGVPFIAGKAGFPRLRRLNNRQTTTTQQIGAQNVTFQKSSHFSKFSKNEFILLKSTNRRNYCDTCHVEIGIRTGVLEMLLFNRLGGGKFSENATPISKIDESSKLLR